MNIQTPRLLLRRPSMDDLTDLFTIYGDPATNTFNPEGPFPSWAYAEQKLTEWLTHWQENGFGMWAISTHQEPEHIIGFSGLTHRDFADRHIINLGYRLMVKAWGKGYATEAAKAMLAAGFEQLALTAISANARVHHLASQHVLLKAGFDYIETIQDRLDAPLSHFYQLTPSRWRKKTSAQQSEQLCYSD
ncbi:GNAT family N-acetyltransferase [Celerinatantimonas sp. YJH-8]|uniref:GNAT family N-acetyltransferase n=1 Tax=Celerinatantimonas sp. YJH-8 TaxID=3228714 RepID=UPI0038C0F223